MHLVRHPLPEAGGRAGVARVVCVGNRWRSDDAAGLEVGARLEGTLPATVELVCHEGEPTALLATFEDADAVWLVDAVSSGREPGTVQRLDAAEKQLPAELFHTSTHHVGLAEAVELARVLGQLPRSAVVYGIEGASFEVGGELSPQVAAVIETVVNAVRDEVVTCTSER